MNAAVDQRHTERFELQGINYELNLWGRWLEKHMDFEGYPGVSAIEAWRHGRGGGSPGHRILCLDMPDAVYAVHGRIIQVLTEYEREAVWIWYVVRVKRASYDGEKMKAACEAHQRMHQNASQTDVGATS